VALSKVLCGAASFSLLHIYTAMIACLWFDNLNFDIFDAMVLVPVYHALYALVRPASSGVGNQAIAHPRNF